MAYTNSPLNFRTSFCQITKQSSDSCTESGCNKSRQINHPGWEHSTTRALSRNVLEKTKTKHQIEIKRESHVRKIKHRSSQKLEAVFNQETDPRKSICSLQERQINPGRQKKEKKRKGVAVVVQENKSRKVIMGTVSDGGYQKWQEREWCVGWGGGRNERKRWEL